MRRRFWLRKGPIGVPDERHAVCPGIVLRGAIVTSEVCQRPRREAGEPRTPDRCPDHSGLAPAQSAPRSVVGRRSSASPRTTYGSPCERTPSRPVVARDVLDERARIEPEFLGHPHGFAVRPARPRGQARKRPRFMEILDRLEGQTILQTQKAVRRQRGDAGRAQSGQPTAPSAASRAQRYRLRKANCGAISPNTPCI